MAWTLNADGWGILTSPTWTVTDQEILGNVQLSLLEPNTNGVSWASGIITQAQALQFLNERQRKMVGDTGLTTTIAYQPATANVPLVQLPQDLALIRRVAWANISDPLSPYTYVCLYPSDAWEQDHANPSWPTDTAPAPLVYLDGHLPSLTMQPSPLATNDGEVELIYTSTLTTLDGSGLRIQAPDDFAPYLQWGVRADLLMCEYEGQDPVRAQHCESRYQEGIELVKLLLYGGDVSGGTQ